MAGTALSLYIRITLSQPNGSFLEYNHHLYNGAPFNGISARGSYTPLAYNPKLFYKNNFAINHHIYLRDFSYESNGTRFCWNRFFIGQPQKGQQHV